MKLQPLALVYCCSFKSLILSGVFDIIVGFLICVISSSFLFVAASLSLLIPDEISH